MAFEKIFFLELESSCATVIKFFKSYCLYICLFWYLDFDSKAVKPFFALFHVRLWKHLSAYQTTQFLKTSLRCFIFLV